MLGSKFDRIKGSEQFDADAIGPTVTLRHWKAGPGKKVGVELTLVEHELLLQALKENGMSQSDVTLVGTATDKTPQAP